MANFEYDGFSAEPGAARVPQRGRGLVTLINWLGGATSILLIGGLGYWGYTLMVRDVTGVPVVRALEGPYREAPDDPGGTLAKNQGMAVNQVSLAGHVGEVAESVALAPAAMPLLDEDMAGDRLRELDGSASDALADADTGGLDVTLASAPSAADVGVEAIAVEDLPDDALATDVAVAEALKSAPDDPEARALALADAVSEGVEPLGATRPDEAAAIVPASAGGVAQSPRPRTRPADFTPPTGVRVASRSGVSPDSVQALSANADAEIPVSEIAPGTRLVQLGAFESPEVAREQWGRISTRFDAYFEGKRRVVQQAEAGGKTFWRLRAEGFDDLAAARRFCTALLSGNADCIPVLVR